MFEESKRKLIRVPTETVYDLTRKAAIELFRTAHIDHLQLKSTMPLESLQSIVKNAPFKLKTNTDLLNVITRYAQYTGATAVKEKLGVTITYSGQTVVIRLAGLSIGAKPLPTKDIPLNRSSEAGCLHSFTVSTFEQFLQLYINQVLIIFSPSNMPINEK